MSANNSMVADQVACRQAKILLALHRSVEVRVEIFKRLLFAEAGQFSVAAGLPIVPFGQDQLQGLDVTESD